MTAHFHAILLSMFVGSVSVDPQSNANQNNSNTLAGIPSPEDKLREEITRNLQMNERGKQAAIMANQLVARIRLLQGNQSEELAKALELAVEAHYCANDPVALLAAGKESAEIYNGIKGKKWKAAHVVVNTENLTWLIKRPLAERIEFEQWNNKTIQEINGLLNQGDNASARKRIREGVARLNAIYQGSTWKNAQIPIIAKYLHFEAITLKSEGKTKDSIELNSAILGGLNRTYQTEFVYLSYLIHAEIADAYYKELELERAEMHARKAYDIVLLITEPDNYQRVQSILKLATICMERGQTGLGLQLADKAIQLVKVHPPSDPILTASTYDTAANICLNNRPDLAVQRSQEACRILTMSGKATSSDYCFASINLGHGYRMQRKLDDARRAYEDAISKAKQITLTRAHASALLGLAKCELEAERYDIVEDHYRQAAELIKSIRGDSKLFMDNIDAGLVSLARRRVVKSLKDRNYEWTREQLNKEIEVTTRRLSKSSTRIRLLHLERDALDSVSHLPSDRYTTWLDAYLLIAEDLFTNFEGSAQERLNKSSTILAAMEQTVGKDYFLIPHLKAEAGRALYDLREGKKASAMLKEAVKELSLQWPDPSGFHRLHRSRFLLGRIQTTDPATRNEGIANIELAARGMKLIFGPGRDYASVITSLAFDLMEAGEFQRAETVASEALELNERIYGKSSGAYISARRIYADLCLRQGDTTRAIDHIREVIDACERRHEAADIIAGDTILLGQALFRQGSTQEAEKTLQKALQLTSNLKELPSEYGKAHYLLGQISTGKRMIPDAIKHYEQAATFYESNKHFHAERRNDARSALAQLEFDQAMSAVQTGDLAKATSHHDKAIKHLRSFAKDDDWRIKEHQAMIASNAKWAALNDDKKTQLAGVWQSIIRVNQLDRQNQFTEVEKQGLPLIPQIEDLLGKEDYRCILLKFMLVRSLFQVNHPQRFNIFEAARAGLHEWLGLLNNHSARMHLQLAHYLRNSGQGKAALPQYENAHKIYAATTPQGLDIQIALFRHAQICCELDLFPKGITEMRQALRNLRVMAGSEPNLYLESLCSNAMLSARLGDYDLARVQLDEAQSFVKSRKMDGSPAAYFLHAGLTQYSLATRNWDEAEKHARLWSELIIKAIGNNSGELASAQVALATSLLRKGDLLTATPMAESALTQARRFRSSEMALAADAKILLAQIRCQSNDPASGYRLAKEAVDEYGQMLSASHRKTHFAWEIAARAAIQKGDLSAATNAREQLLKHTLEQLDRLALVTSGDQFLELSSQARDALYGYLSLPVANQSIEAAYQAHLRLKGITLQRQQQLRVIAQDAKLKNLAASWRQHGADLATEALRPPFAEGLITWLQNLSQIYTNLNTVEAQLAREVKSAAPITVQDVLQTLAADSSLVDYLLYPRLEPATDKPGQWSSTPHYCAFVLRPNQPILRIELGTASVVEKSVNAWQKHLDQLNTTPVADHVKKIREAKGILGEASQAIWSPVANHVKDATMLFISPDGPLAALPFTAFPGSKTDSFLIEDKTILIVPAPRLLLDKHPSHQEPSLLVIGQVDYGAMPGTAVSGMNDKSITGGFTKLTEDHIECNAVNQQYERKFLKSKRAYLTGSQTTEYAFRQNAHQYRWLHVSTHGFFQEKYPWSAILSRSSTSSLTNSKPIMVGTEMYANRVLAHPGLQCGIGLAGANVINKYGQDDGILSALEVSMLDLSHVELIFLSACQTAQGSNKNGEGVLGLQRAFHQAGVQSVVATLWSVPVQETIELVNLFYGELWGNSLPRANALQSAQVRLIRDAREVTAGKKIAGVRNYQLHPYYWAGFSISGSAR